MKIRRSSDGKNTYLTPRRSRQGRGSSFPACLGQVWKQKQLKVNSAGLLQANVKDLTPVIPVQSAGQGYLLGTVDKTNPTISNLLSVDPVFGKDCWRIIHSQLNRYKPYHRIMPGTPIYIDPASKEIFWEYDVSPAPVKPSLPTMENSIKNIGAGGKDSCGIRLLQAVQSYVGTGYHQNDCYELLVNSLKQMGVRYHGNGGLKDRLIQMAREKGLTDNSYLSGEGVILASGKQLYTKTILPGGGHAQQVQEIAREMAGFLDNGRILSFSTPTRGHTGIVGKSNDQWLYINSGRLDHVVPKPAVTRKGVGAEDLMAEIGNWLRLAAKRNEPLQITMGCLEEEKLALFLQDQVRGG